MKKTKRQQRIERELSKIYAEMRENFEGCEGCGTWSERILPSHNIRRSKRRDLITDRRNICLMCLDCGDKVELFQFDQLKNGAEILAYIEEVDDELYNLIITKKDYIKI